ncbi:MAG: response regulator receiver protein [Acidimicrobiia bacterium]|nr:response regulator receiver protein [Acidimicrobiia bacterium]
MARILIVEDDPDLRGLVLHRVKRAGYLAQGVETAASALQFFATKQCPDLVVLDVTLPDGSGLDLLQQIRGHCGAEIPAIFLSARMGPDDIAAGVSLGSVYLTKPFVATALLNAISASLEAVNEARNGREAAEW